MCFNVASFPTCGSQKVTWEHLGNPFCTGSGPSMRRALLSHLVPAARCKFRSSVQLNAAGAHCIASSGKNSQRGKVRDAGINSLQYSPRSPAKARMAPRKSDTSFYFHTWEMNSGYKSIPNAVFWEYNCSLFPLQFDSPAPIIKCIITEK